MLAPGTHRSLPVLAAVRRSPALVERPSARSVRLSVTDRCDFACTYCRPSKHDGYEHGALDLAAWAALMDGLLSAGVRRFRLTGGEPLLHPRIVEIVQLLSDRGVEDLALTTNASRLARLAGPLRAAGLHRINVSIDTLDADRFRALTRGGRLAQVLRGIDEARRVGLGPIKLNAVILRGDNDDELERLVEFAWERDLVPRFLEVMPIAEGAKLVREKLVTVAEMRERLAHLLAPGPIEGEHDRGPARYARARRDSRLRVGFISGTSDTYCATCDRLRVSSTGVLRPCLATEDGVDAAAAAQAGESGRITGLLAEAWSKKPDGQTFKGCTEESAAHVSMRAIGG